MTAPTATTEAGAEAAIVAACSTLHLPTIRTDAGRIADDAARQQLTHRGYLAEVLTAEVDERDTRRRARRIVEARFPRVKRLDEFDCDLSPVTPATVATLAAGAWIERNEPVVLLGDSSRVLHYAVLSSGLVKQSRLVGFYLDTQPFSLALVDVHGGEFTALDSM